jgi:hypothetical protein
MALKLVQRVDRNYHHTPAARGSWGDGTRFSLLRSCSRLGARRADTASVVVSHGGGGAEAGRDLVVLGPRMGTRRAGDGQLPVGPRFGRVRRHVIHCCVAPFVLCERWRSVPRPGSGAAPVGERATDVWPHGRIIPGRRGQAGPAPIRSAIRWSTPGRAANASTASAVRRTGPASGASRPRQHAPRPSWWAPSASSTARRLLGRSGLRGVGAGYAVPTTCRCSRPRSTVDQPGWVDDDVGSTANTRNAIDVVDRTTMTVVRAGSDTQVCAAREPPRAALMSSVRPVRPTSR